MGWQVVSVVQLFAGDTVINPSGVFVYNGTPGPGNPPIFWTTPPGTTTDPFGNTVAGSGFGTPTGARIQIDQFGELELFNGSNQLTMFLQPSLESFLIYTPPAGAGKLAASLAATSGTDNFGNNYLAGASAYAASFAASLQAGFLTLYTGSQAGGWTGQATIETDVGGDLLLAPAGAGSVQLVGNAVVSGTLSVNGSGSTGSSGLPDGTIHGTSGGASAGTAHTHGPGSFAVGNGVHSHVL